MERWRKQELEDFFFRWIKGDNLLSNTLSQHESERRLESIEIRRLSREVKNAWIMASDIIHNSGGVGDLSEYVDLGIYPNGHTNVHLTRKGLTEWDVVREEKLLWGMTYSVGSYAHLKALEVALDELGHPPTMLITDDLPGELADRTMPDKWGGREVVELSSTFSDLKQKGVNVIGSIEMHSPEISRLAMKAGIIPLDFSVTPTLMQQTLLMSDVRQALMHHKVLFGPLDNGALGRNLHAKWIFTTTSELGAGIMLGNKAKSNGTKVVDFFPEDLNRCGQRLVFTMDDRAVGGGTILLGGDKILNNGSEKFVVMITYAQCVAGFVDTMREIIDLSRFIIVVSDLQEPLSMVDPLVEAGIMRVIPIKHKLPLLGKLVMQGTNFWGDDAKELHSIGMDLNAWHYPQFTSDYPEDFID